MSKLFLSKILLVVFSIFSLSAHAQSGREGDFEFTLQIPYLDGESFKFDGGATADLDSDVGFGFGFGYYITDRFAGVANITWHDADYEAERILDDGSGTRQFLKSELETWSVSIGGDYYFSSGNFRPFLNAGIGWTWVDTNVPSGLPDTVCWWDPWFGYTCNTNVPTHKENSFSYSAGAGLRWDFRRNNFLKLGYYQGWMDYDNARGSSDLGSFRLELGFSY